jgi:RNA polymerase sigma factor (sigma-70 family)
MQNDTPSKYQEISEQLTAIKANDEGALKAFYQQNFPKIRQYVIANHGSEDEAKDIYQEAFLAMWRNIQLDKFRAEGKDSLTGYLYRIAKNKWLDYLRSAQFKITGAMPADLEDVAEEPTSKEDLQYIEAVKEKVKQLGDKCREVLRLFYYEKQSLKKIAEVFNWTEATAKNNKYRCIEQLRNLITRKAD